MIESTLIYRSFFRAAEVMPDDERLVLYDAIFRYSFDGIEPDFEGHAWAKSVFEGIRPNIDSRNKAVTDGKKGGRPKRGVSENEKGGFLNSEKGGLENSETKAKAKAKANIYIAKPARKKNAFTNFDQREYDDDQLEGMLLGVK